MNIDTIGKLEKESHSRVWWQINSPEKFIELGEELFFPKGAVIVEAGAKPLYCWYVLEGKVITTEITSSTGERYYNFNEEDSMFMECNVFVNRPSPVNFMALTDVRLIRIRAETLLKGVEEDPDLSLELLVSLSYKFMNAMDQVREATQCSVIWKVCNLLLTFADRYGKPYDGKILIKERISQQMMANLLGINRITMVRTIKELREAGLVEQINGFYCIRDRDRMQRFMQETAEDK